MECNKNNHPLRFEFRVFGQELGREKDGIRQYSTCSTIEEVRDIYLVTDANDRNNVKIRSQSLEIKVLRQVTQGLELWEPCVKLDFPMASSVAGTRAFQALALETPTLTQARVDRESFMMQIIWPHQDVRVATVFKQRAYFKIGRCRVEIDHLLVNGAAIQSISLECEEAVELLRVRRLLDMERYPNTSYLLALKRIMGIVPCPQPSPPLY